MHRTTSSFIVALLVTLSGIPHAASVRAHERTLRSYLLAQQAAQENGARASVDRDEAGQARATCRLTVKINIDGEKGLRAGLVRVTDVAQQKPLALKDAIEREANWYAIAAGGTITVPQAKLKLEVVHGLETIVSVKDIDVDGMATAVIDVPLKRFYRAADRSLRSGNTHLHLMKLTHAEAIDYLQTVPRADDLDLLYVSHLRRIPDERHYITNQIVENSLPGGELARLSAGGLLLRPGEEHRHNFGPGGEGFGHVMLLDIAKLIQPVSIGPGIMQAGTDGLPLQRGIMEARGDHATVVWCHNTFGFEDVPNWLAGTLDAQNIFDGGNHGGYEDSYYRYLNLGLTVPFSTGTDWFMYDFNRVYVPVDGELTSQKWLAGLASGRSFITNGPLLELQVDGRHIGDTIRLDGGRRVEIKAVAVGREDFRSVELIHNGDVIQTAASEPTNGFFAANLKTTVTLDQPGWLALRIPNDAGENLFGKKLFAHTSPIYVESRGRRIFRRDVAEQLIKEMESNIETIQEKAVFATDEERDNVLDVHRQGIAALKKRIAEAP